MRVGKDRMNSGASVLPYSLKGLQALAETLKIHQSFLWVDPVTQAVSIKEIAEQRPQQTT